MKTLKVIAALLHYPTAELQAAADDLVEVLNEEGLLNAADRDAVAAFVVDLAASDLMEMEARYIETFDRGRSTSLHLFEHVHGESRDRGQAMVDLLDIYNQHGFDIAVNELPDYVPLFLEYCSSLPEAEARSWLGEIAHILQLLHVRLTERENPYAVLFPPLLELAGAEAAPEELVKQVGGEARDDTPEALDKVWAEEPVTFGMGAGSGCSSAMPNKPEVQPVVWGAPRTQH